MNEAQVLEFARDAVLTMLTVATPIMLVGLVVGLTVSLFSGSDLDPGNHAYFRSEDPHRFYIVAGFAAVHVSV